MAVYNPKQDETEDRVRSYPHAALITRPCILAPPPPEMTLGSTEEMDPKLWGNLQHHIDLDKIFAKLPFREFFQLRLICKDFNARASGEKFLEANVNPLSKKPFFCLVHPFGISQVFLEYDRISNEWHQLPIPTPNRINDDHFFPPKWSAGGYLIFVEIKWPNYWIFTVFDLHRRMQHKLPPLCRDRNSYSKFWNLEGLVVNQLDNTFQLVIGSIETQKTRTIQTFVYNSITRAWNLKIQSFPLELIGLEKSSSPPHGSVYHNGNLYISMHDIQGIMSYELATHVWSSFQCPSEQSSVVDLGCWDGHLYAISSRWDLDTGTAELYVHQLFEGTNKQWVEVCSIPLDLFDELFETNASSPTQNGILKRNVQASFCDEYVFISVFLQDYLVVDSGSNGYKIWCKEILVPRRFALLNLKTKKWERLNFLMNKHPQRIEIDDWKKRRPKLNGRA